MRCFSSLVLVAMAACGGLVDRRLPNGTVPGLAPATSIGEASEYARSDCVALCDEEQGFVNCVDNLTCNGFCDNDCESGCLSELQQEYWTTCGIEAELYMRCVVNVGQPTGCDSMGVLRNASCDDEWDALTRCSPLIAAYGR
jgi:hypothetical protein